MTHRIITSKFLRLAYARELWQARIYRKAFTVNEFNALKLGIESGIWSIQKQFITTGL